MADSIFWRELGLRFRELPDLNGLLSAAWYCDAGSDGDQPKTWTLGVVVNDSLSTRFAALARVGGGAIDPGFPDPFSLWLDRLAARFAREVIPYRGEWPSGEITFHFAGTVDHVCRVSADYCSELEVLAFESEVPTPHTTALPLEKSNETVPLPGAVDDAQPELNEPPIETPDIQKARIQKARSVVRRAFIEPLLKNKGWSQGDFAMKAREVDYNTVSGYLNGKTKKLRASTKKNFADALGIDPSELPD